MGLHFLLLVPILFICKYYLVRNAVKHNSYVTATEVMLPTIINVHNYYYHYVLD